MFAFGLFTQVRDSGPQGPLVFFALDHWATKGSYEERKRKKNKSRGIKKGIIDISGRISCALCYALF